MESDYAVLSSRHGNARVPFSGFGVLGVRQCARCSQAVQCSSCEDLGKNKYEAEPSWTIDAKRVAEMKKELGSQLGHAHEVSLPGDE